tara:strand:- start:177 stop:371 length:195 start_codon:yes stop_codon:yes gene_type:complete
MKILASSPYAPFNAKEWNSLSRNCKKNSQNNFYKFDSKSYKKSNFKKSLKRDIQKTSLIQLSFA